MKKICIYDTETENLLSDVNYQFDRLGLICGIVIDLQDNNTYKFIGNESIKDLYNKLLEYDYIVSFNGLLFDNILLSQSICTFFDMNYWRDQLVGFGKHKDLTWKDVPKDYLKWMHEKDVYPKMLSSIIHYATCIKNKTEPDYSESDRVILEKLNSKTIDIFDIIKKYTELDYPVSLGVCTSLTINKNKLDNISNHSIPQMFKDGKANEIIEYCIEDTKILKELFEFILKYEYILIPQIKKSDKYKDLTIRIPIHININDEEIKEQITISQ